MKILGTGSALPQMEVSNEKLSQMMDTSDEWIRTRTGICSRRILSSTETISGLAIEAAKRCVKQVAIDPTTLDYIICHNMLGETITPSLASQICRELGSHCPTFDMNAACTGFIYALDLAQSLFKANRAKNILIVCAESPSQFMDWDKRDTSVLFGDGAGAVVVSNEGLDGQFYLSTQYSDALFCRSVNHSNPFTEKQENYPFLEMRGRDVFKLAVKNSYNDIVTVLRMAGLQPSDINFYLLHQANIRILEAIRNELQLPLELFPHNIENHGNTSSASIPLLLDELNQKNTFKRGDKLVLSAFGAGFTSGSCVIEW